jgi:clan AA aspartic protease
MIAGVVQSDEARIRLAVIGSQGQEREIEAIIDTGYTSLLTLPPDLIVVLGLRWQSLGRGTLADGSECLFDVYEGTVVWDGKERRILVDEADTDPLVGMALLNGYQLKMQVRSRGRVTIKRLPSRR